MRADEKAGSGVARVRLSFEEWSKGGVKPAVVEVPVNPVAQAKK